MWPPNFYLQSPFSTLACSPVPPPNNLKCAYHQNWRLRGGYQMHTQDGSHVRHGSEDAELLADFTFSRITWQIFSRPPPLPFPVTFQLITPTSDILHWDHEHSSWPHPCLCPPICELCCVPVCFCKYLKKVGNIYRPFLLQWLVCCLIALLPM